jgi:hypothetical protein
VEDLPLLQDGVHTDEQLIEALLSHYSTPCRPEELVAVLLPSPQPLRCLTRSNIAAFRGAYEELLLINGNMVLPLEWVRVLMLLQLEPGLRAMVRERASRCADIPALWELLHTLAGLSSAPSPHSHGDSEMNPLGQRRQQQREKCAAYGQGQCRDRRCQLFHPFIPNHCRGCGAAGHRVADCPHRATATQTFPARHSAGEG